MRAMWLILLVAVAACGGSSSGDSSSLPPGTVTIGWTLGAETTPVTTTVAAGTPIRWQSGDGLTHSVVADSNPPPSPASVPGGGASSTQVINSPGTFSYHCGIHPGMRGTLTVQ